MKDEIGSRRAPSVSPVLWGKHKGGALVSAFRFSLSAFCRNPAGIGIVIIFLLASTAFANTGLTFLEIPVGARESALGGAGVALITGPTSSVHNPAAVAFTPRSVALVHTRHFADTRALFVGFTVRRGKFALSPHYWGTTVPDIEFRTDATSAPVSTFDAQGTEAGGALAMQLTDRLAVGIGGHFLYQKILFESSSGWAFDAGAMARDVFLPGLTAGLAMQNLGQMDKMLSETPKLPTALRGGVAYEYSLSKFGTLMGTVEGTAVKHNTPRFAGGFEYRAPGFIALRAGYVTGLASQDISLGLGLFYKQIRFDYAFIPYRESLGEGHRLALTFDI